MHNCKYFLYILYEEDNYLCDFNHENTEFKSLLSVATDFKPIFETMHNCSWEIENQMRTNFYLTKRKQFFQDIEDKNNYDLIYFDAFGFPLQPELWSEVIFEKMYEALLPNGVLVTYACRTPIRKAMLNAGFSVEKLPGAPGKREMLRATKKP